MSPCSNSEIKFTVLPFGLLTITPAPGSATNCLLSSGLSETAPTTFHSPIGCRQAFKFGPSNKTRSPTPAADNDPPAQKKSAREPNNQDRQFEKLGLSARLLFAPV